MPTLREIDTVTFEMEPHGATGILTEKMKTAGLPLSQEDTTLSELSFYCENDLQFLTFDLECFYAFYCALLLALVPMALVDDESAIGSDKISLAPKDRPDCTGTRGQQQCGQLQITSNQT
ncbi:UNVERIFIED_CONTAM: hypothetical protein FKN15_043918 [Acipenser sinensis]